MTSAQLWVKEHRSGHVLTLALTGEIDMATAIYLREAADRGLQHSPHSIVLDFTGVTFCDSQGLSALISLNRQVAGAGSRLVLANLGDFMRRLLEITGLHAAFQVEAGHA